MLWLLFFYFMVWKLLLLLMHMLPILLPYLLCSLSWTLLSGRLVLLRGYFICRDDYVEGRLIVYRTRFTFLEIWCWWNLFWGCVGWVIHCYYFFWWFCCDWYCDGWVLHGSMFLFWFYLLIFIWIYGRVDRDLVRSWGCFEWGVDGGVWF